MRLLLPLLLTACLQLPEQASQETSDAQTKKYLSLAYEKVFADHKDLKGHEAYTTALKFFPRISYGKPVKLGANKSLYDAGALRISKVGFSFSADNVDHDCMLENDKGISLLRKIPFDTSSCRSQGEFIYGKYALKHREHTIAVAAKIELKNGEPTHLYLRRLSGENAAEPFEYSISLDKVTPHSLNYTRIAYKGKSGDEEYELEFDHDKKIWDKMFLDYGEKEYITTSHVVIEQKDYDAFTVAELESGDNNFVMTCIEGAGLNKKEASSMSIYERGHVGSDLLHFSNGACKHNIYGLSDPAVVAYLQECQATCRSSGKRHKNDPHTGKGEVFVLKFEEHEVVGYCEDEVIAFYRGKGHLSNRLYIMSRLATGSSTSAIWYDCKTKTFQDAYNHSPVARSVGQGGGGSRVREVQGQDNSKDN